MIFVGIDPGITETAWVALDEDGDICATGVHKDRWTEPKAKRIEPERLVMMVSDVRDAIWEALPNGDFLIAIEEPFVGESGPTALKQYGVFAALVYSLYKGLQHLVTVPPPTIKKFIGVTKKGLIAREVYKRWGYQSDDHNLVDAYAIARWAMSQRNGS